MKLELNDIASDIAAINSKFAGGVIVNRGSLDFALSAAYRGKDWHEQAAFVVRTLICDHIFEDGNKRTAAAYVMSLFEEFRYKYGPFKVDRMVLKIAKNNITSVKTIRRMIENAASKNIWQESF